uniref:Uncharacterized protein n=1 Tax=viral metagenome TaxID=1070528 RepID=A0A6C0J2T7_9ZZZZ
MIFTLDLVGSTIILACLWLLVVFSYISGRMVKMGDPEDPHNNLMRPENDVNVCNYDFFGVGGMLNNAPHEIKCYLESKVHTQSKALWKLCNHTLYDVLHEARNTKTLNVAVFVANLDDQRRTTVWGDQQSDNLKSIMKQSTNDWRRVLHDGHPDDFRADDHDIKIAVVVQPGSEGNSERYGAIDWPASDDVTHGLLDFAASGMSDISFRHYHANQLRNLNLHMSVVFENSTSDGTYGYVVRRNYMTSNKDFLVGHCFTKGVTIYINDTMGADLPYNPWLTYFIIVCITCFVIFVAMELISFRRISPLLVVFAAFLSAGIATMVCNKLIKIPSPPVVNGHPKRFSSDVFPVSLLTHELGHTLLMVDHYKVKLSGSGGVVSTSLPGPTKLFSCVMIPVSVMGAENHITHLDAAYVNAMWSMKQGRDYVYSSPTTGGELWRLKSDAKAEPIDHGARASAFIEDFVSTNSIDETTKNNCAPQSLLPRGVGGINIRLESIDNLPEGATANDNMSLGPGACVTLGDIKDLFERSCAWNDALKVYEPQAVCNPINTKRVSLTGNRYYLHQYMNIWASPLELMFVIYLTHRFVSLWKKNELENMKTIYQGGQELHYRELLDWPTIIIICIFITICKVKAENVQRCVGCEDSIANWVTRVVILLAVPMLPLLARRLGVLLRDEVTNSYQAREGRETERLQTKLQNQGVGVVPRV